ncbi:hemocytin-like [Drosophila pseudoobscura]|uniref:Hemocytin-like n=1 Tax=Drosophila pseudoobscura pseudoobscura TaxID=46245 RepID=A0A6I8UXM8_DROPS|nr:hemocytin [Drosophila pseudoobscura]
MDTGLCILAASLLSSVICYSVEPTRTWVADNPNWGPKKAHDIWFSQVKKPFPNCPEYKFPINTDVNCVKTPEGGECEVSCIGKNHFYGERPTVRKMILSCRRGTWGIKNGAPTAKTIQHCDGACICRNGGICNGEKVCHCRKGYGGVSCEKYKEFACPEEPPQLPRNSKTVCRGDTCEVQCSRGFSLADGRSRVLLKCEGTKYIDLAGGHTKISDCEATCSPVCLNGGKCIAANVCECPPSFRGKQCQYPVSSCNITTFNGNFQCDHAPDRSECRLTCPSLPGVSVQGTLQSLYVCDYSTGQFQPTPAVKCIYPPNRNISQHISTSDTQTNGTVTITGGHVLPWPDNLISICDQYGRYNNSNDWISERPDVDDIDGAHRLRPKPRKDIVVAPKPSVCSSWNGRNIRTFDGLLYRVPLNCAHTLVSDKIYGAFHVSIKSPSSTSPLTIQIQWQSVQYTLENLNGSVTLSTPSKKLSLPVQVLGMKIVTFAQHIEVDLESVGLQLIWDHHQQLAVHASVDLWQKLGGLCGHLDGNCDNDLMSRSGSVSKAIRTFTDSWRNADQTCVLEPDEDLAQCHGDRHKKAVSKCKDLLYNLKLKSCLEQFNQEALLRTCISDQCACDDGQDCSCNLLQSLVDECRFEGLEPAKDWRNLQLCPISCSGGRIYQTCGPQSQPTCENEGVSAPGECFEGCYCPEGKLQYRDTCIERKMCPCELRGREFQPGEKHQKDCNTCLCQSGKWQCTDNKCDKRCSAFGDPHYRTFDGKRYDFQGRCLYYLLKTSSRSVEGENIKCSGAIDEAVEPSPTGHSCTRSIVLRFTLRDGGPTVIKLDQKLHSSVNGEAVTQLPLELGNCEVVLRLASHNFLTVTFDDGLVVWWNGQSTVHIDAPYSYFDNTAGLCGTFNDNTKDDFLTPDGDYEGTAVAFANKWRTKEMCAEPEPPVAPTPCSENPQQLKVAEEMCSLLRSDTFSPCHWAVDPTSHYEDCIADICAAKDSTTSPATTNKALCELLADYAHLCVRNGIRTSWRQSIKQCSIKCPDGQEYDECGDSCALSCHDLQHRDQCKRQCIEGCRCPKGHFLNDEQECVPQKACSCHYEGISFKPGYKEVRPGPRVQQLCTCLDGLWQCHDADKDDLIVYPPLGNLRKQCAKTPYAKFVSCAPKEPRTCKNMHDFKPDTAACRPGCVCDDGYVYDVTRQQCVPSEKCSCYHAGRSFDDGDTFKELCNLCVCQGGSWKCSRNDCESSCSVWGDSHFSTFDGKDFDFLGECDYILSKGVNDQGQGFSIVIQNVLCGSSGVTCSKSLEINLSGKASEGKGQGQEQLKLSAGGIYATDSNTSTIAGLRKQISSHSSSSFHIYKAGVFVVVEVLSLHLQIKWDEGTRVYVKIGNEWQGRVAGLCGNNNGNSLDDFKSPSGGQETEPTLFGHSWRTHQQCVLPQQLFDSCQRNPQRRAWSELQCSVLKSPLFAACHVEVPLERYLKRCIFDTCACDQGGDCECLCTAVAAYADACAQKSINVRWRTPHFCPMQCDTHCSDYSACTPACPVETCDNLLDQGDSGRLCHHENCVEGCLIKPCPPGQIYLNDTHTVCVPRSECKPVCLVREDITYYEGDITYTDDCATCRCSKKKEVCSGKPCPPVVTTEGPSVTGTGTVPNLDRGKNCVRGWSRWLDRGSSAGGINLNDVEPLPKFDRFESIYGTCNREYMTSIECRVKDTKQSYDLVDDNVVCNLDRGLVCVGKCHDYEIRVHCLCDDDGYTTAKPPPPPPPTEICDPSFQMFKEYPGDCYKYLRCEHIPGNTNWHWVPGLCGTNLMFNTAIGACDQVSIVSRIRPQCRKITDRCRDDEEWNDCANQCEHTCHFFGQQLIKRGLCNPGEHCKGGCVPKKRPDCRALGKFWRDENTCVDQDDCPCLDDDNDKYVQPHGIIINDQFDCQCVFNQYVCVPKKTTTEAPPIGGHTTTTALPLIPTTLTPPVLCPTNSMVRFFTREPSISDSAFSASSSLSNDHVAHLARLHRKPKLNAGAWTPKISDQSQYLQVDFERPQGIYGLLIAGDPHNDNYVTLFKVLYSLDGEGYHELIDQRGEPQVLIGPKDSRVARAHVFQRPIEAKSVRLYPLRWQNAIAIRFDLLLCNHVPTTTAPVPDRTTPLPPTKPPLDRLICDDPLGVDNGKLQPHQVTASSIWLSSQVDSQVGLLDLLQFRSQLGWRPLANKQDEYVDFDFLEPRNVTAVQTRGGVHGWVTAYRVLFSLNRLVWNELPGPNGDAHIFEGNRDAQGIQTNGFVRPLVTRYLRLVPTGWEKNINWRIEPLGCFLPYPNTTKPILRPCTICKGIDLPSLTGGDCPCSDGLFWTGSKCIERNLCPCIDNFTPYPIGTKFENKDCEECVCLLGGIISCKPQTCPPCPTHMRRVRNGCHCECQLCPPTTRLCPTSGDCIPNEWWCNHVQNCADDEDETCDPAQTTLQPPTTIKPPTECPVIECPPGYTVKIRGKIPKVLSEMLLTSVSTENDDIDQAIEPLKEWLSQLQSSENPEIASVVRKVLSSLTATEGEEAVVKPQRESGLTLELLELNELPLIPQRPETEASPALPLGIIELLKKIGIAEPTISDYSDTDQAGDELELDSETLLLVNGVRGTKDSSELSLYGYNFQLPRELQALMGLTPYIATRDLKNMELCDAFCCLPQSNQTCMDPKCPEGYEPIVDTSSIGAGKCPIYTCRRSRIPDDTCDITGRIFSTFDGTVYKYDICSHTLARDTDGNRWSISTQLQCAPDQPSCGAKTLIISDQERGITISILPNQRVIFNGYEFSVRDLALVNAIRRSFVISQIGETIVVVCRKHKFWVQYAASGNIRIGVSQDLLGRVDGLCGFYNGRSDDDKRTPQRLHVISSTDFGDAWYDRKVPLDKCRPQVCPVDLQQRALQICQAVRHPSFGACSVSVNIQDFLSRCVENTCECLKTNAGAEGSCRCDLLQQFVGQCLAVNRHLQLTSWRSVHRCNQTCRPPLIHHDCYRQRCEQQCGDLQSGQTASVCPSIPRTCFSGCYCPEGTVRRGEECVPIEDCKDCKCTLFGASKFVTYDGSSYSFKGNCTYLVTRDLLLPGSYHFQVYATIKPCGPAETESCVQALHVTAGEHTLHIERHAQDVKLLADGYQVSLWPHQSTWLKVIQQREQQLIVQLPQAKLELIVNLNTLQFQLSVPSVRYGSRMEGLCGNCNGLSIDDLHINPLKKPTDQRPLGLIDFVTSWQIDEPRLGINTRPCQGHQICKPLPRERNLCYHLIVQSGIFDRCPLLVDPLAFIQACQKDTCTATTDKQVICDALSAYAAECNAAGVCVDWRPFAECPAQCPPGLSYKSCDCDVNCDTGVDRVDQSNLAIIFKGRCLHTERHEGCFCPDDKVLHHGKCVSPSKCITCGDGRHVGDVWQPDKCTNCTCLASGQVSCEKEQCGRDTDHICQKGFTQVVLQRDYECCPTRICVGDIEKPPGHVCEKPKLPDCGPDQHRIVDKDVNECPIYICECKPKVQCEPTSPVKLRPGEELQPVDDGCCPGQRVVCVPSKCPKPPAVCDEHHYELISEKLPGDCCAVHKCVPPKDKCLSHHDNVVQAHQTGDKWQDPLDPCVSYECVVIGNLLQTVNTILSCDKKCPPGYTYEHTNSAKCCGSCVPTGCHHDGKLYKPDEQWHSLDKCITYTCVSLDGQLIRHESHETCADVSQCPLADLVDNGGCCKQCKSRPPTLDKTGCQAVSLPLQHTVRLISYKSQDHGQCFNEQPIQGVTQCEGACDSAFKYNPLLIKFEDKCSCCAATGLRTVLVKVKCADGNYLEQSLEVPTGCSCEPCNKHHLAKVQPVEEPNPVSVGELLDNEKDNDDEEELNLQDLLDQSGGVITR